MDRRRQQRLSLDLLRGFRAAAKHLSFTRAAHGLFVTQPAISHEMRKFEEQLGQPLFRRVDRSLQLTAAGWELYHATEQAMAIIDSATERIANPARRLSLDHIIRGLRASLRGEPARAHPDVGRLAETRDRRSGHDPVRPALVGLADVAQRAGCSSSRGGCRTVPSAPRCTGRCPSSRSRMRRW